MVRLETRETRMKKDKRVLLVQHYPHSIALHSAFYTCSYFNSYIERLRFMCVQVLTTRNRFGTSTNTQTNNISKTKQPNEPSGRSSSACSSMLRECVPCTHGSVCVCVVSKRSGCYFPFACFLLPFLFFFCKQ